MKWVIYILNILIGTFFIISGFFKIFPIEPFEFIFVEKAGFSWVLASFFARIIIGLEISLGFLFIFNQKIKSTAIISIALVSFFTIFLLYDLLFLGNNADCGCMGTLIKFTNTESIFKNIILLALLFIVYKYNTLNWSKIWVIIFFSLFPIVTIFIINKVSFSHELVYNQEESKTLDFDLYPTITNNNDTLNFKSGKLLIAFFSTECAHCKIAAKKLALMNKQMNLPKTLVFYLGKENKIPKFREETGNEFPYISTTDVDMYFSQTNGIVPCVYYLEEGKVLNRWYEFFIIEKDIEKIINQ
jgi:hypothetical protein